MLKHQKEQSCPSLDENIIGEKMQYEITAKFYNNWFSHSEKYFLETKNSTGTLLGPFYDSVSFSGIVEYTLNNLNKTKKSLKRLEKEKSTIFRPCPGYDYSAENTYESASASALYSFSFVENILNELHLNFKPIKIKVAPLIVLKNQFVSDGKVTSQRKFLVNNAYYDESRKEIVFLPQGKNKVGKIPYNGIPLWEIPFVGAHEYGHHIFSSIMTNYLVDKNNFSDTSPVLCFNNHADFSLNFSNMSKSDHQRQLNITHVMDAFNEAAADLFARTVTPKEYKFEGIGCFEYSRDVEYSRFASGTEKKLDENSLSIFLSKQLVKIKSCYSEQDFQDPHIIGAIIAHGIFNFYEYLGLNKSQRVDLLIDWLKLSNEHYRVVKTKTLRGALEHFIKNGVEVIKKKYMIPQEELCRIIGNSFPIIDTEYNC